MTVRLAACLALALLAWHAMPVTAAEPAIGKERARSLPMADVHFHLMPWMKVEDLVRNMDRNNIRWTGGANPLPAPGTTPARRVAEAVKALGKRYVQFAGTPQWVQLRTTSGPAGLETDDAGFRQRFAEIERLLASGEARGMGELHVNALNSAANPGLAYKIKADAPTLKALFDLSAKYQVPLALHAQWDEDTAEQLGRLAGHNPKGLLWLSHCGVTTTPADIRAFFKAHANAWCDISFRSYPQIKNRNAPRIIFDQAKGLKGEWAQLIEEMPERFMLGIDDVHGDWSTWQAVVDGLREGLLAHLSPASAEMVAWKNAQKLLRLE